MFCRCIRYYIVSTLVLREDLIAAVCPAYVMMLESNVARFCRDERCFGEVDGCGVVGKHNRGVDLRKAEILRELPPMD